MRLILSIILITGFTLLNASAESALSAPAGTDKSAAAHNAEGVKSMNGGDTTGAMGHFKEAVRIAPDFAEAHFNLALAYHTGGNHGKATAHFKIAKQHGSKNPAITGSGLLKGHVK